jgi:UDP-N-acetylglucosamine 2-epimerase (non-hydrolysing)
MIPLLMPVYGTRPEAVKMAPVISALARSPLFDTVVTVTGQHREMLDQMNDLFGIRPDVDLDVIQPRQSLVSLTSRLLDGLDRALAEHRPHAVLVQGDTTTSTTAALAAFYHRIPVVHLEAGLRSFDLASPFPEEGNRRVTAQLSRLHLAPTAANRDNLLREGIPARDIAVTGNTVIDALLSVAAARTPFVDGRLEERSRSGRKIVLITSHRRENQGTTMIGIGTALARVARENPGVDFVLPAHRNPAVREMLLPPLTGLANVLVVEPLPYGEFTRLLAAAYLVITDSGGVQEEAPSLGVPVLVIRDTTERPEAVTTGAARLIGTDEQNVVAEVTALLRDPDAHAAMAAAVSPYGDGFAAARAVAAIAELFGLGERLPDFGIQPAGATCSPGTRG